MEAIKEMNEKINGITMLIKSKYPALLHYLNEMQLTIPEKKEGEASVEHLQAYCDILTSILKDYADRSR